MPQKTFWSNAQLLRVLATFAIVFIHIEYAVRQAGVDMRVLDAARLGTDLFLVLAGFLTIYMVETTGRGPLEYLKGRLIRLWPLYALATVAAFAFKNLLFTSGQATLGQLAMSLAFIPYGDHPVLYPTWTLALIIEFAVLVTAARLLLGPRYLWVLVPAVCAVVAATAVSDPEAPALRIYGHPMLLEFAAGALLAKWAMTPRGAGDRRLTPLAIAAVLLGLLFAGLRPVYFADLPRAWAMQPAAVAVLWGALQLERSGLSVRSKAVDQLAKLSFCIYLLHWFWNVLVEKGVEVAGGSQLAAIAGLIATPFAVTAIAAIAYRFGEAPITRALSGGRTLKVSAAAPQAAV